LNAARCSLRAAPPLQLRAARRPLDAARRLALCAASSCSAIFRRHAPLTSSRTHFAASSCSAPPWMPRAAHFEPRALCSLKPLGAPRTPRAAHFEPRAFAAPSCSAPSWMPRAAHFEPRALCSLELLGAPFGRREPLTSSRTPFAASSCSAPLGRRVPLTSSRAPFAASSCSAPLLDAARRSLRAARPLQPRAARRAVDARAANLEPRALCSLKLLGAPWMPMPRTLRRAPFAASSCSPPIWTPRAAYFEPRALCSLELLGAPLDAARRSLRAARSVQPRAARRSLDAARR